MSIVIADGDITFNGTPTTLATKSTTQMGVTVQLGGINNWIAYLDDKVTSNDLDEDDRTELLARFDGYQMKWSFDTTTVLKTAEGALDAACVSSPYANGGYCAGITWTGTSVLTPKLWANWVHQYQFNAFVSNKPLGGEEDVTDWHTTETTFLTTWSAYRWQPKYEFIVEYYDNEFRFSPETRDAVAQIYTSTDATTYSLSTPVPVTFTGSSGLFATVTGLIALGLATAF